MSAAGATSPGAGPEPRHAVRIAVIWAVVTVIGVLLIIFVAGPHIPPFTGGSVQANDQHDINVTLLTLSFPVASMIWVYFAYAAAVFRQPAGDVILDGPPITGNARIQTTWLIATAVMVLGLATFGTVDLLGSSYGAGGGQGANPLVKPPASSHPFQVQVIGQQWLWTFRYPSYGGVETPVLALPVNRWIEFHVTSLDVVHSFWAVELGVKADAVPGSDNVVYVEPLKAQPFQVRCAELCGLWHGHMNSTAEVLTQAGFATWIAQQQQQYAGVTKDLPPYSTVYYPTPLRRN